MKKGLQRKQVQTLVYIVLGTCAIAVQQEQWMCLGMQRQIHITLCNLVNNFISISVLLQWMCLGIQGPTHITGNNLIPTCISVPIVPFISYIASHQLNS